MLPDYKIENLLIQFNQVCNCSNKYLGNKITAKYFDDSRPDFDWLHNFQLNKSNQIIFEGFASGMADSVSSLQLLWFQKWIKDFIKLCSKTIKHFPQLI